MDISREILVSVADKFLIPGELVAYETIHNGNINGTFFLDFKNGDVLEKYVFQRINTYVFKQPGQIMSNIGLITSHMKEKIESAELSDDLYMHFMSTSEGNLFVDDEKMGFWRAYRYVPQSETVNQSDDPAKLESAGKAFGQFQNMLSDFDASRLYATIPNFHNTRWRIENFLKNVEKDECGRVSSVMSEIEDIKKLIPTAVILNEMLDRGELPLRVTHNDTKINNVLFDTVTGEAKTVIDLDTVMPGLVAHDFGDAIRFGANKSAEDEPDLSKVGLDMNKYRAFAKGFVKVLSNSLTENEIKTLALGAFTMTFELVVRFLDDYITGDKYFKLRYPEHNLVRTRCQLKLAKEMYERLNEMNAVISELSNTKF